MDTQGKAVKSVNSKLTISKSSSSSTKSVGVIMRSMSKKLKESSQMYPLAEHVEKNLHSPSYVSESDANKSPPSFPRSVSSYSFTINVAPVMIARLINKADNVDASHVMGKQVKAHDEVEAPAKQHYTEKAKYAKEFQISSEGLILVHQLKEFIEGTIRSKIEESSKSSLTYSKPYTPKIDGLKMPMDYQPPKFQWRNLSLNCKDRLSEASAIEMCIQRMHWGLYPSRNLSKSFEELATRAHDMELSTTASGVEGPPI
ncbi:UNVERIFIED_CONTAM: hypothetical protein Sradi_6646500 [Sesamum radiatum]|uniref:Uncharacterized protein n=1 Tax=Sesamum radiatum TaxID=300843 RepID=A0AAW2JNL8_SESRA